MRRMISLGAGVQSTMALMAAHGGTTPMPDCAIPQNLQINQEVFWHRIVSNYGHVDIIRVTVRRHSQDIRAPSESSSDRPAANLY